MSRHIAHQEIEEDIHEHHKKCNWMHRIGLLLLLIIVVVLFCLIYHKWSRPVITIPLDLQQYGLMDIISDIDPFAHITM